MKGKANTKGLFKQVSKITSIVLAVVIALPLIAIYSVRGINAIKFNISGGVQERIFVNLGGIEQALHIRGQNTYNPVIIWLHGGPGWSDAYELAHWQYKMENDYTFIRWDQRGSGRTYRKTPDAPLSLDILISDLYELVNYAANRFNQPVYIVGDSWGTVLGLSFASRYPETIAGYVGVAQNIDQSESLRIAYEAAYGLAMAAGNSSDAEQLRAIFEKVGNRSYSDVDNGIDFIDFVLYQSLPSNHLTVSGESQGVGIFFSPWFGFGELRELIGIARNNRLFFDRNRQFFYAIDDFIPPEHLEVPVAFIMGGEDFVTAVSLAEEYYNRLEAPSKNMFIIEGSGHSPYRSQPNIFAEKMKKILASFTTKP